MHFNSHAHVERDDICYVDYPAKIISTHTLTWSVTSQLAGLDVAKPISTHTLTWSVTSPPMIYRTYVRYFNSHAHVERD